MGPAKPGDAGVIGDHLTEHGLPTDGVIENLADFIIAREDGRLVGCVGLEFHGRDSLLRSLAVAPRFRGRGLGRQLVDEIVARAVRKGAESIVLLTEDAMKFFLRSGFVEVSRDLIGSELAESSEFGSNRCRSAVCMRRSIGSDAG